MNAILLTAVLCCGADNIYTTTPIQVVEIIDDYNMLGIAAILGEDQICWFKINTRKFQGFTEIVPDYPYSIMEGTKEYDGKRIKVFHYPSSAEKQYIARVNKKNRDREKKMQKRNRMRGFL